MLELVSHLKDNPTRNKLVGRDYMIIEYKCPIEEDRFEFLTKMHFITYIISGTKEWVTSKKTINAKEGDALFIRRGQHTIFQNFEVDHCVLTFFVNDDFIRNFMRENSEIISASGGQDIDDTVFELDVNDVMKTLFLSIYNYLKMGPDIPRNLVEIKFKELLFTIILNHKNKRLAQFFSSLNYEGKTNLDEVMRTNFQQDLQLEEFARLCGRSLSAFKRDFKNYYQESPGKWLSAKRLEYATSLLLNSDMNINEICHESGFKNSSHFNKLFKDKHSLPPRQFRERNRGAR